MDKKDNLTLEFDSNVDETFSINQEYLNKYKTWRRKEEIQKCKYLEAKYGNLKNCTDNSDSSSSSDESEDELAELIFTSSFVAQEISESVEKSFFKALSALKSRDPKIYRSETAFFGDDQSSKKSSSSKNKESTLRINDYERMCLLEEMY
ncbi:Protein KRI1 -like protein [Trichinella pseudospiralis]|uniref:Protein KRI1-like protein n=1 Tax=Trichinella pseudospiralis TaxID=6337 RepID=A0A0V1JL77_TRIPS|nr:Protein KRI1 -like protein [Trichinella pseudospiralis]